MVGMRMYAYRDIVAPEPFGVLHAIVPQRHHPTGVYRTPRRVCIPHWYAFHAIR